MFILIESNDMGQPFLLRSVTFFRRKRNRKSEEKKPVANITVGCSEARYETCWKGK